MRYGLRVLSMQLWQNPLEESTRKICLITAATQIFDKMFLEIRFERGMIIFEDEIIAFTKKIYFYNTDSPGALLFSSRECSVLGIL